MVDDSVYSSGGWCSPKEQNHKQDAHLKTWGVEGRGSKNASLTVIVEAIKIYNCLFYVGTQ